MRSILSRITTAVLIGSLLAGCGSTGNHSDDPSSVAKPANPMLEDKFLRPVRITSGLALAYVQPETASQILCQIVRKDRWKDLLESKVGLHPAGSPDAECLIASEWGGVSLSLQKPQETFTAQTTIGGRPAAVHNDSSGHVVFAIVLTDDALRPSVDQHHEARNVLEAQVIYGSPMDPTEQRRRATKVLEAVVPLLAKDGDHLPDIDNRGRITYVPTTLTPGAQFVDLPQPVQSLQLCTLLLEQVKIAATRTEVDDQGRCRVVTSGGESVNVSMDHTSDKVADYPDRIAGRPAHHPKDMSSVRVRLLDAAQVDLVVDTSDSAALAGKLVPLLLG